jgi:hypothetical protein
MAGKNTTTDQDSDAINENLSTGDLWQEDESVDDLRVITEAP